MVEFERALNTFDSCIRNGSSSFQTLGRLCGSVPFDSQGGSRSSPGDKSVAPPVLDFKMLVILAYFDGGLVCRTACPKQLIGDGM